MDKKELLRNAYANAVNNMVIDGLDNEVCYIVIRESMKLYMKGHGVDDIAESEINAFIKDQIAVLHTALENQDIISNFELQFDDRR
ncbi:MAG: hypothetical protein IIZ43_01485 [Eubacterium sp.]|nr:hypothetical protein [Eubacterium sp.]